MPTNKYLFIQAQTEASVYIIAHKNREIIIGISVKLLPAELLVASYKPVIGLHARLSVFQVTAVSMCTQKQLTFKISNLQLFKLPITNSSPFPRSCWFTDCAEKDAQDNIYIKIRDKKEVSLMKN